MGAPRTQHPSPAPGRRPEVAPPPGSRPPARPGLKQWAELSSDPGNELSGSCAHQFPRRFMNWPAPQLEMRFRVVATSPLSTRSCS